MPPEPPVQISGPSEQRLHTLLAVAAGAARADPAGRSELLSRQFLDVPYAAHTLVGSPSEPEQLVVDLQGVDCFTYADYVEALKRSTNRDQFVRGLAGVRYRDGIVGFQNRRHFFTDWAVASPAIATDIATDVDPDAIEVTKHLNQKDSGGVYVPGAPVVPRTVSYIPSGQVDAGVVARLRTGDYLGAYAEDGGLDVTHVGIFVDSPTGPVLRNASSLRADDKVVDTPLFDYLQTVPGVVVLRPVQ
ncbi:DUF1460 domain-containing protein [Mycobacterium sp. NPDC003449]